MLTIQEATGITSAIGDSLAEGHITDGRAAELTLAVRRETWSLGSGCPFCSMPMGKPHKAECRHPENVGVDRFRAALVQALDGWEGLIAAGVAPSGVRIDMDADRIDELRKLVR